MEWLMNREEIIRMAREAGFLRRQLTVYNCEHLERFAALVAANERTAVFDKWHACVMSDLENGVKFLNKKAASEWIEKYPAQSKGFPDWIDARGQE